MFLRRKFLRFIGFTSVMIRENTSSGQSVLVIGVGNTIGVSQ